MELAMPATPDNTQHDGNGETAAALSNAVVHLLREYTGRGPTRAKSHITDDLVTVVLQDTLTTGERNLVEHGQAESVLNTRQLYQQAMRADLIEAVERLSQRTVIAFMSSNHIEPDVAIETFVLAPQPDARNTSEKASAGVE